MQLNTDTLLTWYLVTQGKVISICDSIYLKMFMNSGLSLKWNNIIKIKQTVAKHDHTKVKEFMVPGEYIK